MAGRFSVEAVFKAVDRVTAPVSRMQSRVQQFTRSMTNGLRKANRAMGKLAKGMAGGLRRMSIVGGAALISLGLIITRTADKLDALAKRARRLDFPIEELQEWQFVAEQAGLSTAEFDKSLEKFAKTLGETAAGTATLITLLKKSNPELLRQVIAADSVSEAMELFIDAIAKAPTAMEKAALSTAAFGRAGAKMINIAELGADAIAKLRKEQRENGIVTAEQAAEAEKFNDALNSLKKAGLGFIQTVVVPLLPMMTELLRTWRAWAVANREILSEKLLDFLRDIRDNFENIVEGAKKIGTAGAVIIGLTVVLQGLAAVMTVINLLMLASPIVLGITAAVLAVGLLVANFDKVKAVLKDIGALIANSAIGKFIGKGIDVVGDFVSAGAINQSEPQVVSPQERVARSIEESRSTETTEVTIKDETGRAEITRGRTRRGLQLQSTGAF